MKKLFFILSFLFLVVNVNAASDVTYNVSFDDYALTTSGFLLPSGYQNHSFRVRNNGGTYSMSDFLPYRIISVCTTGNINNLSTTYSSVLDLQLISTEQPCNLNYTPGYKGKKVYITYSVDITKFDTNNSGISCSTSGTSCYEDTYIYSYWNDGGYIQLVNIWSSDTVFNYDSSQDVLINQNGTIINQNDEIINKQDTIISQNTVTQNAINSASQQAHSDAQQAHSDAQNTQNSIDSAKQQAHQDAQQAHSDAQNTQNKIDDMNKSVTDSEIDGYSGFFSDFDDPMPSSVTDVLTAPISIIDAIDDTCVPVTLSLFSSKSYSTDLQIPCGTDVFWDRDDVSSFRTIWSLIFGGFVIYKLLLKVWSSYESMLDPSRDSIITTFTKGGN